MKKELDLTNQIKNIILSNGFDSVGVSEACKLDDEFFLANWMQKDFHVSMKYM